MKRYLLLITIVSFTGITFHVNGQCNFTPVIIPDNIILCPDATDTLSTTEAYDSYQWYKNNKAIEGATSRTYVVEQYNDAGSLFKVEATLNGCTATSKKKLVDGYAFLPAYVITSGDPGIYDPFKDVTIQCPGDEVIMTLGLPYTENIQWYNLGKPIKEATAQTYSVTKKGSYTVCGSPAVCPDFTDCQLIPMNFTFDKTSATITERNDTLFASKAKQYQWYYYGNPIPGAKDNYLVPDRNGKYTLGINSKYNCSDISDVYIYTGAANIISVSPNPVSNILHVHALNKAAVQVVISDLGGNRYIQLPFTNNDAYINLSGLRTGTYLVQLFDNKNQLITSAKIFRQ